MGQGGCTSLCSAVNSCTPLQGLITQVSLEIPATETPGGRGAGGRKNQVQCVPCLCRAPPQIIILKNIFSGKNLFQSFIKDVPRYIFQRWGWLLRLNWSGSLHTGKDYVTDKRLSSKIHRWQLSWISICGAYCFHQLLYLGSSTYFSLKQQVCPSWVIPNVSHLSKTIEEHDAYPLFLLPFLKAHYNMDMQV